MITNTKPTSNLAKKWKLLKTAVMCRFFHPIETLENCSFVDTVSGKSVGKFKCKKCDKKYLANSKRDIFRCYV
jgi:hypothetical protein